MIVSSKTRQFPLSSGREKERGELAPEISSYSLPPLRGSTSENWHLGSPPSSSLLATFNFMSASPQRSAHFPLMLYLSGSLGDFWNMKSVFGSDDCWIIAYFGVEFPSLDHTRLKSLYFFGRRFFPLPPSLT